VTPQVHQALAAKDLLPQIHIVDTGFLDAELLVTSKQNYAVDLLGPTRPDRRWQTRTRQGFGVQHFGIDWQKRQAVCPEGHINLEWRPRIDVRGNMVVAIRFSPKDCGQCLSQEQCCPSAKWPVRRSITVRPQEQYEALQAAREREKAEEYVQEYARRAGIEGTLSRGIRSCGLRRSRFIGQAKVHLGHLLTAAAINFLRVSEWLSGVTRAKTRKSPFRRLMTVPA
jgi:transposase